MQLRDYTIPKAPITLPGKAVNGVKPFFEVRGLCADDLTFLISQHHEPIVRALQSYQENRTEFLTSGSLDSFVMTLVRDFPALVAEVISAASDSLDDETREIARKLPITTQLSALSEISRLTMEETGGLKNLLAGMRERLADASGVLSEIGLSAPPKTN
jgi:hypothetical protein